MGMERVDGISQLFIKRRTDGTIEMMLEKVTDYMLISGDNSTMNRFLKEVSRRFKVRKSIIDAPINFNGTRIEQDEEGNIKMVMKAYMKSINQLDVNRARRKESEDKATLQEYK